MANMFKNEVTVFCLQLRTHFVQGGRRSACRVGSRSGVRVVEHEEGTDPAAVIYDAVQSAGQMIDNTICDTAGRLLNKTNLMKELRENG